MAWAVVGLITSERSRGLTTPIVARLICFWPNWIDFLMLGPGLLENPTEPVVQFCPAPRIWAAVAELPVGYEPQAAAERAAWTSMVRAVMHCWAMSRDWVMSRSKDICSTVNSP